MGEAIVVAPDCFTRWGGAQYLDSPALGRLRDAPRERGDPGDRRALPHASPRATARAIGGKSSGGFGALVLAMRHPDLFAAVASHAGDMALRAVGAPGSAGRRAHAAPARRRRGVRRRTSRRARRRRGDDFTTMMVLRPGGRLLARGRPAGRRRAAVRPRDRRDRLGGLEALEGLGPDRDARRRTPRRCARMKLVFLDAGTRDEHNLDLGARDLRARGCARWASPASTRSSTTATAGRPTATTSRSPSWRRRSARAPAR